MEVFITSTAQLKERLRIKDVALHYRGTYCTDSYCE